ncbi:hypothetical protein Fleli_1217 [Bernardetia litoralis DSM 6794]|uniref:Uncharacterized protein n=1 Tax=Bernardetia litoralis (strain ATCC 23117 / DSM 6794 / NBRC 15988 / NCIMB 1366 / Fx l1 / Sio-4) TaxID=880071 RepID=I4AI69_BERLS|nr:hypothetical protein [Bernardetia litoralis]AFM03654.1 hypothetical protein Fleli_1217 [Bernardetia litoralis DSM 6794]
MDTKETLPFGMIYQENPELEKKRGHVDEENSLDYDAKYQINKNFSTQIAKAWCAVTSSSVLSERKDVGNKLDKDSG